MPIAPEVAGHCDIGWHTHSKTEWPGYIDTCRCDCIETEEQMTNLPKADQRNENVYVVFQGLPKVFTEADHVKGLETALDVAEDYMADLAEESKGAATLVCMPRSYLNGSLVAQYEGVILKTMGEVIAE